MALLDLRCPVPSDGAHRLAWAIALANDPAALIARIEAAVGVNTVDRLLNGSLVPGERMGAALWEATRGAVNVRQFYRRTPLRWWQAPAGVAVPQRAKRAA